MPYNEKSLQNLRPNKGYTDDMTQEEKDRLKAYTSKGGKVSQEVYRKAKSWKEVCNSALTMRVDKETALKYVGDDINLVVFDDDGLTDMQTILTVRAFRLSADGNCRYMDFIRDTSGQKPKEQSSIELSGEIMTAADRALLDKINARMNAGNDPDT